MTSRRSATADAAGPAIGVRLLGDLDVRVDGIAVDVGGPRPRALLSLLALEAGSAVPLQRIVDALWDGEEPPGVRNAVQVTASRVRKALGPAGSALQSTPGGGYQLEIPREGVDVAVFEQQADHGRVLLAGGDAAGAAAELGGALALWRGDALDALGRAADGLRVRLDARRLGAHMDKVTAELELGRHDVVLPELEELVARHPLDEHLVALLVTALYRSGRQADALAAYSAAARRLDDELGVDPGAELRSLHQQVLRQEVPGPGALGEAAAPSPAAAAPTATPSPPVRPRSPLVGRGAELARALELLADPTVRVLTVLGPGGAGKTRLAMEIAARHQAAGDVLLVALAGVEDAAAVVPEIARAAGVRPMWAGESPLDVVARALDGRPWLLVLDNLEQLLDRRAAISGEAAGQSRGDGLADLDLLLDRLPGVTLLCTSRSRVQLAGEHLLPLGPLAVPPVGVDDRAGVLRFDAVQLFRDRAMAAMPEFDVTDETAADVGTVTRMLDGLPLALELAAARVRLLPPAVIARREDGSLALLAGGSRSLPDRHRSIRAALDWSVALLDADEEAVFAWLSVFAGGWTLEAATAVGAGAVPEHDDVVAVLARLVDKSLVVADGSGRSWMLELVREYAAELLGARPDDAETRAKAAHRDYFVSLAERVGPQFRTHQDAASRAVLDAEAANIAVALGRVHAAGDSERLARLVVVLLDYWYFTGALTDAERWLAAAQAGDVPAEQRAQLHHSAGNLALVAGDLARARTSLEAAHALAADQDDDLLLARITALLGVIDRLSGNLAGAVDRLEVASGLAARAGANHLDAIIGNERGEVLAMLGRVGEGRPLIEHLAQRALDLGGSHLATSTAQLALLAHGDGDHDIAAELVRQALAIAEHSGFTPALGDVLTIAGTLELQLGSAEVAVELLRRSVRVNHEAAQLLSLPDAASLLGAALGRTGHPVPAARLMAAGRSWRAARGIAVGHPLISEVLRDAEADVAGRLTPEALRAATAVGEAAPFGSLEALESMTAATVIDLRGATLRRAAVPRP